MTKSTMGVRLDEETQNRLEALSRLKERTPHYLMKTAITHFLDPEEQVEAERLLVKSRWEKYEITGEALEHDEVKSWAASLV